MTAFRDAELARTGKQFHWGGWGESWSEMEAVPPSSGLGSSVFPPCAWALVVTVMNFRFSFSVGFPCEGVPGSDRLMTPPTRPCELQPDDARLLAVLLSVASDVI